MRYVHYIRGAGSVLKLVEPTWSSGVICDSSSGVQVQTQACKAPGTGMGTESEALTNLHFFVAAQSCTFSYKVRGTSL